MSPILASWLAGHLLGAPATASTQDEGKWPMPLAVSVYNHSYAVPFRRILRTRPWHPGVQIGTEYSIVAGRLGELAQTGEVAWFQSPPVQEAFLIYSELAYRYVASFGPLAEVLFGPGYLHSFSTRPVYELEGDHYRRVTDWGSSHFMLSLGLGVGFDLSKWTATPLALFTRYQFLLQFPGFLGSPALPSAMLHIGARYEMRGLL